MVFGHGVFSSWEAVLPVSRNGAEWPLLTWRKGKIIDWKKYFCGVYTWSRERSNVPARATKLVKQNMFYVLMRRMARFQV
jgi:hypothetical protein